MNHARFDSDKHHRRSTRLKDYDYSQAGVYFITICTQNRDCLFGEIVNGEMRLNDTGHFVQQCWFDIPLHFPHAELDAFTVMPNHVHGIIVITHSVGANNYSPLPLPHGTSKTIGSIVRGFKIGVTKWFRTNTGIYTVWQRNYFEHVIRDEPDLARIRQYVSDNPMRWADDEENPANITAGRKG
ncbi:MAG: hypothetical protein PHV74_05925 [Dehalococcoidia bacterium]|nr:hypothetical protein [Dehalococcoidia bacterium]